MDSDEKHRPPVQSLSAYSLSDASSNDNDEETAETLEQGPPSLFSADEGRSEGGTTPAPDGSTNPVDPARKIPDRMHIVTPCHRSIELTEIAGRPVYIKCENCQATGSFQDRGIGHCIRKAYLRGHKRVIAVSGGNAGVAAARAATTLGMPITVVVPSNTLNMTVTRLKREGADVMVHGESVKQSTVFGTEMAAANNAFLSHPFDHPDIWEGHATIVEELKEQLPEPPGMIAVAVGGGGLLTGIMLGLQKVGWMDKVAVIAMETEGTASFNASWKAGRVIQTPDLKKSVARALAVEKPTAQLEKYLKHKLLFSEVVTDEQAVQATVRFADEHRFLIEPGSGTTLAFVYAGLVNPFIKKTGLNIHPDAPLVLIVCGGTVVTLDLIEEWKRKYLSR